MSGDTSVFFCVPIIQFLMCDRVRYGFDVSISNVIISSNVWIIHGDTDTEHSSVITGFRPVDECVCGCQCWD